MATAYFPQSDDQRAADVLKDEGYKMSGNAPIYAILREAKERAKAAGADEIEEKAVVGAPVDALVELAEEAQRGPARRRQRRPEHHRGSSARLGARERSAPLQDRRPHRPHVLTVGTRYQPIDPGTPLKGPVTQLVIQPP